MFVSIFHACFSFFFFFYFTFVEVCCPFKTKNRSQRVPKSVTISIRNQFNVPSFTFSSLDFVFVHARTHTYTLHTTAERRQQQRRQVMLELNVREFRPYACVVDKIAKASSHKISSISDTYRPSARFRRLPHHISGVYLTNLSQWPRVNTEYHEASRMASKHIN